METFYVGPQGDAMDKEQVFKADPSFFDKDRVVRYQSGPGYFKDDAPPADVQGEIESFSYDSRLALSAKEDLENFISSYGSEKLNKLSKLIFQNEFNLDLLEFTELDANKIPKITNELYDGFNQGMNLLSSISTDLHDYIEYIYTLSSYGEHLKRLDSPGSSVLGKEKISFTSEGLMEIFFKKPEKGKIGMGSSLMNRVSSIILKSLASLENMSPNEFYDVVYPAIESIVRKVYDLQPHIKANIEKVPALDTALDAYLEAISFVLRELIGELNFEYVYEGGAINHMFIPTDPEIHNFYRQAGKSMMLNPSGDPNGNEAAAMIMRLGGLEEYSNSMPSIPIPRDLPDYYNTKYSVNLAALKGWDVSEIFNFRMHSNLFFGVGLEIFAVSGDDYDTRINTSNAYDDA
jgi:hypothetical protein